MRRIFNFKYLITFFVSVLFIFEAKAESWDDLNNYDISWYTTDADLYISKPSELAGLAYLINNNFCDFTDQTIHILSDIDLSGKNWVPIGYAYIFKGSIEGHNHSITNLSIDNTTYKTQGLIGQMQKGYVRDLTLQASINTQGNNSGILVANAANCTFQNLNITGSISYINQTISTSTEWNTKIYSGGVIGCASNCTFIDIISHFEQSLIFGKSGGKSCYGYFKLYAGSIVGYGSDINKYIRCEGIANFNNTVYGYNANNYYTVSGSTSIYCGGIVGYDGSSKSTFTSCLSKIKGNKGSHLSGNYDSVNFYTSGFGCLSGKIENSVAVIDSYNITGHEYSWVAAWYHTSSSFFDCGTYKPSNIAGCYINNDVSRNTSKVNGDTKNIYSSTSYNKAQMNTQSFVNELNLYSKLHMDGKENWTIKNNQLILKHEDSNNTGIQNIEIDKIKSEDAIEYYNLKGMRITEPSTHGIYIRRQGSKSSKVLYYNK